MYSYPFASGADQELSFHIGNINLNLDQNLTNTYMILTPRNSLSHSYWFFFK